MPLDFYSSSNLLVSLKAGDITCEETIDQTKDKFESHHNLNAICGSFFERAFQRAKEFDELDTSSEKPVLFGLPITIKECFDLEGTPSTFGLNARKNDIPTKNDMYVDALLDAGAIIVGKTNVSQLLSFIECDNPVYGRTNHHVNSEFSCGGSSGGEGVIVGVGASPLGLGTDIGGSVRVPAAVNGACSIKPTEQRIQDRTRWLPESRDIPIKSVVGPISNDVDVLASTLNVLNRKAAEHWNVEPLLNYKDVDAKHLTVGYYGDDGIFPCSAPCQQAVIDSVERLKNIGVKVVNYRFPDLDQAERLFYGALSLNNGEHLARALKNEEVSANLKDLLLASKLPPFIKSVTRSFFSTVGQRHQARVLGYLGQYNSSNVEELQKELVAYRKHVAKDMHENRIDAVISPILPVPAYLHNSFAKMGMAGTYSLINNVSGMPAGTACVGKVTQVTSSHYNSFDIAERQAARCVQNSLKLPLSVQITASHWREDIVLSLLKALHTPYGKL